MCGLAIDNISEMLIESINFLPLAVAVTSRGFYYWKVSRINQKKIRAKTCQMETTCMSSSIQIVTCNNYRVRLFAKPAIWALNADADGAEDHLMANTLIK